MSRSWKTDKAQDGWVLHCDTCWKVKTEARPRQWDFCLIEFADLGWSINDKGDRCPECVSTKGPLRDAWDRQRLVCDLESDVAHCMKHFGREPLSPAVLRYMGVKVGEKL